MEKIRSKLYSKAKLNKDMERPKIENRIIKNFKKENQNDMNTSDKLILPIINNKIEISTPKIIEINSNKYINKSIKNISHNSNTSQLSKLNRNTKTLVKKNFKEYLKENILKSIQFYLDPLSLKNFMLTCKKFFKTVNENDELWYAYYSKKFNTKKVKYEDKRGKWKSIFHNAITTIFQTNYNSIKNKYLQKVTKNSYVSKKDPYFISNHLYFYLKPTYTLELDGRPYKLKHVFSNKILSHVNFFANFDKDYIDLNKVKNLTLKITEKNLGLVDIKLIMYEIKKKKFEEFSSSSKICKIYHDKELIISTFEKNLIFFFNISIPICKICESLFEFMQGIHKSNLNYFDDVDSKFGLYDYSLLMNIKTWNNIFYTININTLDFKYMGGEEERYLYYEYSGKSKIY